jgi:hypothetical protein
VHPKQHLPYMENREALLQMNIEFYNRLIPYCEKYNIMVATENMWQQNRISRAVIDSTCSRAWEFNKYIDAIDSPWIVGCLDVGHVSLMSTSIPDFIRAMGKDRLQALHIHDTDMIIGLLGMPKSVFTTGNDTICRTIYKYDDAVAYAGAAFRTIGKAPSNRGIDVIFEKAWIKIRGNKLTVYVDNDSFEPLETEEFSEYFGDNGVQNEILYFCHCLKNNEKPLLCMPNESLITMTVNTAEYNSLKSGSEVFI